MLAIMLMHSYKIQPVFNWQSSTAATGASEYVHPGTTSGHCYHLLHSNATYQDFLQENLASPSSTVTFFGEKFRILYLNLPEPIIFIDPGRKRTIKKVTN